MHSQPDLNLTSYHNCSVANLGCKTVARPILSSPVRWRGKAIWHPLAYGAPSKYHSCAQVPRYGQQHLKKMISNRSNTIYHLHHRQKRTILLIWRRINHKNSIMQARKVLFLISYIISQRTVWSFIEKYGIIYHITSFCNIIVAQEMLRYDIMHDITALSYDIVHDIIKTRVTRLIYWPADC